MQRRPITYVITLFSLLAFWVTGAGNTFGYALCFADDGHTRMEPASFNGCIDREPECSAVKAPQAADLSKRHSESARPCSDLLLGKNNLVVSKRNVKTVKHQLLQDFQALPLVSNEIQASLVARVLQPSRVSQTILAHRTVVLLH